MSPEQIQGGTVDPSSDLYSLGITAYEMLAGKTPFSGETALNVAVQHLHDEPERLDAVRPDLPIALCDVVHKLLGKTPQDRYASATELIQELRSLPLDDVNGEWKFAEDTTEGNRTLKDAGLAATRQLDVLMKVERSSPPTRRMVSVVGLGLACGVTLGAGWAYVGMPRSVLEVSREELPRVEKKKSARVQYLHAILEPSEASWQAVADHFGEDQQVESRQYVSKANAELARNLFDQGRVRESLALYSDLADLGEDLIEQRALGLAGMANIYQSQGDRTTLSLTLMRLTSDLEKLGGRAQSVIRALDAPLRERMSRVRNEQRVQPGRRSQRDSRRGGKIRRKPARQAPRRSTD